MNKNDLINSLINKGVLKSPKIREALKKVDRIDFVGKRNESFAYYDEALPIGYGQTISQPFTVVFMLELLEPSEGNVIMDIGSGSGWQSCLLAQIVGEKGFVHAVEVVPELFQTGLENSQKYPNLQNRLKFHCQNAGQNISNIVEGHKDFDRIICAAEIKDVPKEWRYNLKPRGIMVYPKDKGIYKEVKMGDGIEDKNFRSEYYPGFVFVPFVQN